MGVGLGFVSCSMIFFYLSYFLNAINFFPLPIKKACMPTMCTAEARLRVMTQSTNEYLLSTPHSDLDWSKQRRQQFFVYVSNNCIDKADTPRQSWLLRV